MAERDHKREERDQGVIQEVYALIEKAYGEHVEAILVFRDRRERLMWVASPYSDESTHELLEHAADHLEKEKKTR